MSESGSTNPGPGAEYAASGRSWKRLAIWAGLGLVLLAAAFGGGVLVGDDSADLDDLRAEVSSRDETITGLEDDVDQAQDDLNAAGSEIESITGERDDLQDRLKAELSIATEGSSGSAGAGPVDTDYPFEAAGKLGSLVVKPTSLEQSGDQWVLTFEAKNNGSEPVDPFCGGGGTLIDSEGRSFTGDAVLANSTANCGDSLQPGLSATYQLKFKTPGGTEPAAVELEEDILSNTTATWAAP